MDRALHPNRRMKKVFVRTFGVLLAVAGAGAAFAAEPPKRLPAPDHVSPETRAEIVARMGRHADTMSNLIRSVVVLDRPSIRALATRIADEEIVARAAKADSEKRRLNLPSEFFAEQTALTVAARALAAAADGSDDDELAERFSRLTRTCVGCHSVYLHGRPGPHPVGPKK